MFSELGTPNTYRSRPVSVQMQAYYPNGSPYRNLRHAFATIYQDGARAAVAAGSSAAAGGIRSLYRGVGPTTIRGIVLSGTQICSYDQIKQSLKKRGIMQEGVSLHFVASTFAGYGFALQVFVGDVH